MTRKRGAKLEGLSCRKRVELLCDYLDKELPRAGRALVDAHRRSCKPCASLLRSLERTVRALKKSHAGAKPSEASRRAWLSAIR